MKCSSGCEETAGGRRVKEGERVRSVTRDRCANCGDAVPMTAGHPVAAPVDHDRLYAFCCRACRAAWSGPASE